MKSRKTGSFNVHNGGCVRVGASSGTAFTVIPTTPESLLVEADAAMYDIKHHHNTKHHHDRLLS